MSDEDKEGFAKRGTTLEGRVAQLLRLMGYDVTRNEIINDHEIDVCGKKQGERIIVECKEYYTQLINRELILIFATKVRDIMPDESWFVTINDFEPSALELCRKYGIRSINGYELEEFEDRAVRGKGDVEFGSIPMEDRILRKLKRKRTELSREQRRTGEIRKTINDINILRLQQIELPPYLLPATEKDLEEKYMWLNELEGMPIILEDNYDSSIIVNLFNQPRIRGFKFQKLNQYQLYPFIIIAMFVASILFMFSEGRYAPDKLYYLILPTILSPVAYYYREKTIYKSTSIINRKAQDADIGASSVYFSRTSDEFSDDPMDLSSKEIYNLDMNLIDDKYLGKSMNFIFEKESWNFVGVQAEIDQIIIEDVGSKHAIIPINFIEYETEQGIGKFKVFALYALGEDFLLEKKLQ